MSPYVGSIFLAQQQHQMISIHIRNIALEKRLRKYCCKHIYYVNVPMCIFTFINGMTCAHSFVFMSKENLKYSGKQD